MAGPKHLWSGDWERESGARAPGESSTATPPPTWPAAPPPPEPPGTSRRRRQLSAAALVTLGVIVAVVIAGLAVALTSGSGGSAARTSAQVPAPTVGPNGSGGATILPSTPQTTPPQTTPAPTTPAAAARVNVGPTYTWLGMALTDSSSGVTVDTVAGRSPAASAGVDPGDVLQTVGNRPVNTVGQLRSVTAALKLGQRVALTVNRGTTLVTVTVTLTGRPVRQS
ncbi:PDZ domain-containing protein [Conexibacter sp. DBS9H8]|uniref:PDZ domain-containing protein n=1 Tax=Conexibacter sp. DBS9H8 TaxID=2937801 RepID=UPI00200F258C|nr:PDZ domain-containing protein [Conexibacter sp. DBS9H8]